MPPNAETQIGQRLISQEPMYMCVCFRALLPIKLVADFLPYPLQDHELG